MRRRSNRASWLNCKKEIWNPRSLFWEKCNKYLSGTGESNTAAAGGSKGRVAGTEVQAAMVVLGHEISWSSNDVRAHLADRVASRGETKTSGSQTAATGCMLNKDAPSTYVYRSPPTSRNSASTVSSSVSAPWPAAGSAPLLPAPEPSAAPAAAYMAVPTCVRVWTISS